MMSPILMTCCTNIPAVSLKKQRVVSFVWMSFMFLFLSLVWLSGHSEVHMCLGSRRLTRSAPLFGALSLWPGLCTFISLRRSTSKTDLNKKGNKQARSSLEKALTEYVLFWNHLFEFYFLKVVKVHIKTLYQSQEIGGALNHADLFKILHLSWPVISVAQQVTGHFNRRRKEWAALWKPCFEYWKGQQTTVGECKKESIAIWYLDFIREVCKNWRYHNMSSVSRRKRPVAPTDPSVSLG